LARLPTATEGPVVVVWNLLTSRPNGRLPTPPIAEARLLGGTLCSPGSAN